MNDIITLLAVTSTALFLSVAWHNTTFPIIFCQFIARLTGNKTCHDLSIVDSRHMFTIQCYIRWPFPKYRLGHGLNCPTCSAPYIATLTSLLWWHYNELGLFASIASCVGAILWYHRPAPIMEAQHLTPSEIPTTAPTVKADNTEPAKPVPKLPAKMLEYYKAVGIVTKIRGDGAVVSSFNTPEDGQRYTRIQQFFDTTKPCFFEGCEQLRKEYADTLQNPAPVKKGGCQTCDPKAELQRAFTIRVAQLMQS